MSIKLSDIISIEPNRYKLHLATYNGMKRPLDVFVNSREEWHLWNAWRSKKNEFNRRDIFALIDFYHETDTWLFGGVYEVLARSPVDKSHSYEVKLTDKHAELIGRLKIGFKRPARGRSFTMKNHLSKMEVKEILREVYTGETFCSYETINHSFEQLEPIFKNNKPDWKAALENIKGVYLIADKSNGKKYVGSAYGDTGIWSRWSNYMSTGHGFNKDFSGIIAEQGMDYARENFVLSLLEYRPMKTDDKDIIARETYWKNALLTKTEFGYNNN